MVRLEPVKSTLIFEANLLRTVSYAGFPPGLLATHMFGVCGESYWKRIIPCVELACDYQSIIRVLVSRLLYYA